MARGQRGPYCPKPASGGQCTVRHDQLPACPWSSHGDRYMRHKAENSFLQLLQKIIFCSELKTQPLRLGTGCYCGEKKSTQKTHLPDRRKINKILPWNAVSGNMMFTLGMKLNICIAIFWAWPSWPWQEVSYLMEARCQSWVKTE